MALTAAEKAKRAREKKQAQMRQFREENKALRETLREVEAQRDRLLEDRSSETANRISQNVRSVREASEDKGENRYSREELYAALDIGRWSAILDMAMEEDDQMAARLVKWWRYQPDPAEEKEDYRTWGMRWLLREWAAENHPLDWPEFFDSYLR